MSEKDFSPARRLLHIAYKIKKKSSDAPFPKGLSETFDLDSSSHEKVVETLAKLIVLSARVKNIVAESGLDRNRYLPPISRIHATFCRPTLLNEKWNQFRKDIEAQVKDFHFCVDLLESREESLREPEIRAEKDKLATLREQLDTLIKEVLESVSPPELQRVVHAYLNNAREAIDFYEIQGSEGLQAALARGLGDLYLLQKKHGDDSWYKKSLHLFFEMWGVVEATKQSYEALTWVSDSIRALGGP